MTAWQGITTDFGEILRELGQFGLVGRWSCATGTGKLEENDDRARYSAAGQHASRADPGVVDRQGQGACRSPWRQGVPWSLPGSHSSRLELAGEQASEHRWHYRRRETEERGQFGNTEERR